MFFYLCLEFLLSPFFYSSGIRLGWCREPDAKVTFLHLNSSVTDFLCVCFGNRLNLMLYVRRHSAARERKMTEGGGMEGKPEKGLVQSYKVDQVTKVAQMCRGVEREKVQR